ncbi:unnamed protein product [Pedinophyceae sp. YPF-701]|nr:unnamed protein product [Pedinophyceae sp. YPF-701]
MAVSASLSMAPPAFVGMKSTGSRAVAPTRAARAVRMAGRRSAKAGRSQVAVSAQKVAVLGAAGGIGQPMSMLLKMLPEVSELALYDIVGTPGVGADLSHINTRAQVSAYVGADSLKDALSGAKLVVIPAGVPRKPGMTRDDLFNINAGIVRDLANACAQYCPDAVLNIISNPVNSTVPIAAECFKKAGVYDKRKIIGVTTLDVVRSNTFVSERYGGDVSKVNVPVIGGHAGVTILPLLSQAGPGVTVPEADIDELTKYIQEAGTLVVEAKEGKGSATLSMAYAGVKMAKSVLLALSGEDNIVECAYVESDLVDGLSFFASPCKLGPDGVAEILPLPELTAYEQGALEELKPMLQGNIKKGVEFQ